MLWQQGDQIRQVNTLVLMHHVLANIDDWITVTACESLVTMNLSSVELFVHGLARVLFSTSHVTPVCLCFATWNWWYTLLYLAYIPPR